jgi:hypothetical protein
MLRYAWLFVLPLIWLTSLAGAVVYVLIELQQDRCSITRRPDRNELRLDQLPRETRRKPDHET